MRVITGVVRKAVLALLMMMASQMTLAAVVQGGIVVGDQNRVQHQALPLPAGTYRLHLLDPFASGNLALASAGVLLASGTDVLARLDLLSGDGATAAEFSLTEAAELDLFVQVSTQATGAALVSVESLSGSSAGQGVFEQAFTFSNVVADSDRYAFHLSQKLAQDTRLQLELTDMHALGFSFAPFESIVVRVANSTATELLRTWCWYRGDVGAAEAAQCVDMDSLSAAEGQTLSQMLDVSRGFISWSVTAQAPVAQASQLGWRLQDSEANVTLGEDVVIVNRSGNRYAREVGRFTLQTRTTVDVSLASLAETVAPFKLAIISTDSGNTISLDNLTMSVSGVSLNAGEYRVLLADDLSGDQGLIGVLVRSGTDRLLDDVFSLGDFQRLGELDSTVTGAVTATLSLYEFANALDVRVATGATVAARLTDTAPSATFTRAPGRYSLWGRFDPAAADDLYRVQLAAAGAVLGEYFGVTGQRLVLQRPLAITEAVDGEMSVHNFEFPDPLSARFRMVLIQHDGAPLKLDVDSNDDSRVQAPVALNAGTAHIAVFASQQDASLASVIGYRLQFDTSDSGAEPGDPVPPRGSSGTRSGSSGGGSFSSFLLYVLLVCRILHRRTART